MSTALDVRDLEIYYQYNELVIMLQLIYINNYHIIINQHGWSIEAIFQQSAGFP